MGCCVVWRVVEVRGGKKFSGWATHWRKRLADGAVHPPVSLHSTAFLPRIANCSHPSVASGHLSLHIIFLGHNGEQERENKCRSFSERRKRWLFKLILRISPPAFTGSDYSLCFLPSPHSLHAFLPKLLSTVLHTDIVLK